MIAIINVQQYPKVVNSAARQLEQHLETATPGCGSRSCAVWRKLDRLLYAAACFALMLSMGCGATKHFTATEQLLMSDAVDATVAKLDFQPLSRRKVFLDATFVNKPTFAGQSLIVDSNYLLSALRQQMVADGVLLVDNREDAELIAEPRIGALGIDGHDVVYGMPASNALSNASTAVSGTPLLPPLPEISVARREDKLGAAKVAVFAYDRVTREPFWKSGIAQSSSDSRATWVLGVGPFQRGSIYRGTQFAGGSVFPTANPESEYEQQLKEQYLSSQTFHNSESEPSGETDPEVMMADHQEPEFRPVELPPLPGKSVGP